MTILDKDRNKLSIDKLCVSFFYEIVDFFMLDKCSKHIFYPKNALKSEIAASWLKLLQTPRVAAQIGTGLAWSRTMTFIGQAVEKFFHYSYTVGSAYKISIDHLKDYSQWVILSYFIPMVGGIGEVNNAENLRVELSFCLRSTGSFLNSGCLCSTVSTSCIWELLSPIHIMSYTLRRRHTI